MNRIFELGMKNRIHSKQVLPFIFLMYSTSAMFIVINLFETFNANERLHGHLHKELLKTRAKAQKRQIPIKRPDLGLCVKPASQLSNDLKHKPLFPKQDYTKDYWKLVDFDNSKFYINTHDPHKQDIFISGTIHDGLKPWDVFIWNILLVIFNSMASNKSDVTFVDVGANIGYFSLFAASRGFHVIALEPMSRNIGKFESSIQKNGFESMITLFKKAAYDEDEFLVHLEATHEYNQGNGQISKTGGEAVKTITIDNLVKSSKIIIMKIDVEGFESRVLNGARESICEAKIQYIVMEVSSSTKSNAECPILKVLQKFNLLGYTISDIVPLASALAPEQVQGETFPPNLLLNLTNTLKLRQECALLESQNIQYIKNSRAQNTLKNKID